MSNRLLIIVLLIAGCDSHSTPIDRPDLVGTRSHSSSSSSSSSVPSEGLIAHFSFSGTLDSEPFGLIHGINHGTAFTRDRFSRPNSAILFDGQDDYFDVQGSNLIQIQPPISYAFWVNVDQVSSTSAVFTLNYNEEANSGVFAAFDSNGSNPSVSFGDGSGMGSGSRKTFHASNALSPGEWYHIVGVVESVDSLRIYVNGERQLGHTDGDARRLEYVEGPASFGRRVASRNGPPIYFSGKLDEFLLYGIALDDQSIYELFTSGN